MHNTISSMSTKAQIAHYKNNTNTFQSTVLLIFDYYWGSSRYKLQTDGIKIIPLWRVQHIVH